MSDEQKQPEQQPEQSAPQQEQSQALQPVPIVGGGAADLRQMKEEAR